MLDMLYDLSAQLPDCAPYDLKPAAMAAQIDDVNEFVYNNVNNAVYRCACRFSRMNVAAQL